MCTPGGHKGRPYEIVTRSARKESPSQGFAVPAPFRQGAMGTGGRIATTSLRTGLAMTHYKERGAWSAAGRGHPALRWVTGSAVGRADRVVRPYGEAA